MENNSITHCPVLWFVIPCFNEEAVLPITAPMFVNQLTSLADSGAISSRSRVLFVDDGSSDNTWNVIKQFAASDEHVLGISLSRNQGHQNALLAGLMHARRNCDITISVDCDGQDDISASKLMVDEYLSGADVVYGVRSKRETDTLFKRWSAEFFYKFMNWLGSEVVFNHADYRLLSSRALDALAEFKEVNLFLRGLVPLVGFKTAVVEYERNERYAGDSHYPIKKMLGLALDGITSLSMKPIRLLIVSGIAFFLLGVIVAIWACTAAIAGNAVAGWTSLACLISVLGGLQLLSLGIIGEYVGKTYLETKKRPRYIIAEQTGSDYSA